MQNVFGQRLINRDTVCIGPPQELARMLRRVPNGSLEKGVQGMGAVEHLQGLGATTVL